MTNEKQERLDFFNRIAPGWDKRSQETPKTRLSLINPLPLKEGRKALDVACGTGVRTPYIYQKTKTDVKAIDLSPERIKIAKSKYKDNPHYHYFCEDFLEEKEEGFDYVILFNAYPHFLNPELLEKAFAKAIRKGGYFSILHDCSKEELAKHHNNLRHISRLIGPAKEDARLFEKDFIILKAEEGEHYYEITGQRK